MPYQISVHEHEPIVVVTLFNTFNARDELFPCLRECKSALDGRDRKVYYITEVRDIRLNMADLLAGMAAVARGELAVFRHPNVRQAIVVTTNELVRFGTRSLARMQYGRLSVRLFDTLDEALASVRQTLTDQQARAMQERNRE